MRSVRIWLLIILSLAFGIRIAGCVVWEARSQNSDQNLFSFGDSAGYWHLAEQIAHGKPYQYNSDHAKVFRAPAYPIFLSPLFLVAEKPSPFAARVLGVFLGTISVILVFELGRRLFSDRVGLVAAGIIAFYPGAVATSILVLAEALFVPFMLGHLLATTIALKAERNKQFILYASIAGLCYGLACLTRPSWILFGPFSIVVGLALFSQRKKQIAMWSVSTVVLCITMIPWWVRNYQVTGRFVLTTLQTGPSLYDGLNPNATGASNMEFAPIRKSQALAQWRADGRSEKEFEFEFNEQIKSDAIKWAKENPIKVAGLAIRKFWRTWNPLPNASELSSFSIRLGIALVFTPLLVFCIWGVARHYQDYQVLLICLFPAVYFTLLHMVFVGSIRYRHPPMFTFSILAAATLISVFVKGEADSNSQNTTDASDTVVGINPRKK